VTAQHKHTNTERIKVKIYIANILVRSARASAYVNCFKQVALVMADGKWFQHETQRFKKYHFDRLQYDKRGL